MLRAALLGVLAAVFAAGDAQAQTVPAQAQSSYAVTTAPGQAPQLVPGVVALCPSTNGTAIPCPAASGDPGSSAVRANDTSTTSRDQTHDDTMAAAQAGSGLKVQPVPLGSPQQTPAGDTSVAVAASTSTLIWTTSAAARLLRIAPNNATCFMRSDGGTASATSTPIPGGYVFNLVEPPPNANVTAFCTTAANVAVSQGN